MKRKNEYSLIVDGREYTLKILGKDVPELGHLFYDHYFNASLFIKDEKNKVTNHQPMNNQEVSFSQGDNMKELISRMAQNYDVDLKDLKDIQSKLVELTQKDNQVDVPPNQSKGVLPF